MTPWPEAVVALRKHEGLAKVIRADFRHADVKRNGSFQLWVMIGGFVPDAAVRPNLQRCPLSGNRQASHNN